MEFDKSMNMQAKTSRQQTALQLVAGGQATLSPAIGETRCAAMQRTDAHSYGAQLEMDSCKAVCLLACPL